MWFLAQLDLGENQLDGNFEAAVFYGGGSGGGGGGVSGAAGVAGGGDGGSVAGLRKLTRLVVCDNALNGPLPGEGLALLTALEELDLSRNMFTGIVAVELPNRLGRHLRLVRKERRQLGFA